NRAAHIEREAVLEGQYPVRAPPSHDMVHNAARRSRPSLTLAEWQLIGSAEVHDVWNVDSAEGIVTLDAEAWQIRRAICCRRLEAQQLVGVSPALRVGVVGEQVDALAKRALEGKLNAV